VIDKARKHDWISSLINDWSSSWSSGWTNGLNEWVCQMGIAADAAGEDWQNGWVM